MVLLERLLVIAEGGWLRQPVYMDSYTRWWVTTEARHNYCTFTSNPASCV